MLMFAFDRGLVQAEFQQERDNNMHCFDLLSLNFATLAGLCWRPLTMFNSLLSYNVCWTVWSLWQGLHPYFLKCELTLLHADFLRPGFSPLCFFFSSCMQVLSQIHGVASKNKSWLLPYLTLVPRLSPSNPLRISPRETLTKVGLHFAQKPLIAVLLAPCCQPCSYVTALI